jgi:hypothetical protein
VVFDTARTIRVVGDDEAVKVQRVNDPNDPKSVDLSRGRFDIVIDTGPSYSTKRAEAAESMAQFFQVVPQAAQLAGDLYAQAQDWPIADKFSARLKHALPPGVAEEDEDPTPEQQAAKAQAMQQAQEQQQLQQQAVGLEMAEKAAAVKKAEADASKAEAEAGLAQITLPSKTGRSPKWRNVWRPRPCLGSASPLTSISSASTPTTPAAAGRLRSLSR